MTRIRISAVAVLVLVLMFAGPVARATTIEECQAALAAVKAEAAGVVITAKDPEKAEKDRASLLGKLDQAALKLDQAKFCDAIQKLGDFQQKVDQLVKSGEINTDPLAGTTGQDLLDAANDVITCVSGLSAQSGGKC